MSYENDLRLQLLSEVLGGACEGCGIRMIRLLDIDHRNGDGKEDRERFEGNNGKLFRYYLDHPDEAKQKLQPLCHNCHDIKSRLSGDYAWRRESEAQLGKVKDDIKDSMLRQLTILLKLIKTSEERQALKNEVLSLISPIESIIDPENTEILYNKPQSEVSKQKLFMEIFNSLYGIDMKAVEEKTLLAELVKTGRFSEEEARVQLNKFSREGRVYELRPGIWGKG